MKTRSRSMVNQAARLMLAFAVLLGSAVTARSATRYWNGSYSIYWSAPLNWNGGVAPQTGDDLIFPAGAANKINNNNNIGNRTFRSIQFADGGYTLQGSEFSVTEYIQITTSGDSDTIECGINLQDSVLLAVGYSTSSLNLIGDIDLGSYILSFAGGGPITLSGVISGTGELLKDGTCTIRLSGGTDNAYTGQTRVLAGTLELAKTSGDAVKYGSLSIGNGTGGDDTAIVRELLNFQIGSIPVTINEDGWLDVGNYSDTVGSITFNGGHAGSSATGILNLGGNVTVNASSEEALFDGNLYMGAGTRTVDVGNGSVGYDLKVSAVMSGGAMIKTGSGLMGLLAANTYTGATTVNQGNVYVVNDSALGSTAAGTTVSSSGSIQLVSANIGAEPLVLDKPNSSGNALTASGNSSWAGNVMLNDEIGISTGGTLEFSGVISGTGGLVMNGYGDYTFSGASANTYSGNTTVKDGTLYLDKDPVDGALAGPGDLFIGDGIGGVGADLVQELQSYQIASSVDITVNESGRFDLNNYSDAVGGLVLNAGRIYTGTGILTLGGNVTAQSVFGTGSARIYGKLSLGGSTRTFTVPQTEGIWPALQVYADVSGSGNLVVNGGFAMSLEGNNTYTGTTTVQDSSDLSVQSTTALGDIAAGTVVEAGSSVQVAAIYASDIHVGDEPLSLAGYMVGGASGFDTSNSWSGPITLDAGSCINVWENDYLKLSGTISGASDLVKKLSGTLMLTGSGNNVYTGDTIVEEGTLLMGKTGQSIPHSLVIGGNGVGDPSAVARQLASSEIYDDVTVNASGFYDLGGFDETVRNLYLFGGADVETGAGTLTMAYHIFVDPLSVVDASSSISGNLKFNNPCTLTVPQGMASSGNPSDLVIDAVIEGGGKITKEGTGELQLTAANTFTGPFDLNAGGLRLDNDLGLGTTAGGVSANGSAYLQIHGAQTIVGEQLTLNSTYGNWGALYAADGPSAWTGDITLQSDAAIGVSSGAELTLSGSIGGSGVLRKVNTGTVILAGSTANTYVSNTYVDSGTLVLNKSIYNGTILGRLYIGDGIGGANADVVQQLTTSQIENERVIIADSGLFDMNGLAEYIGSLSGSGHVNMGSGTFGTGGDGTSTTYSGLIAGSGILRKSGLGTFTLTGNNSYTGNTEVNSGTLRVNGSQPSSAVLVGASGRLSGIGTVGAITSNGRVAPGASAGELGCAHATLQSGSTYELELNGYMPVDYDQLDVNGSVKLGNPYLSVIWGFVPGVGDAFTVLDNDGVDAVVGTFNGLAEGASVVAGNVTLQISYAGGDGNDVVLAATAVSPLEPLAITSIDTASGDVDLAWEGGVPYYVVEKKTALTNATWMAVTTPTRDFAESVPSDTTNGFYRVTGGN